jgi:uroporphyrinogen decarboxylase
MAMLVLGSVLANNDIFSDEAVREYSVNNMRYYIDKCFRGGAGPQIFYHCCGNHETDYKEFHNLIWSPSLCSTSATRAVKCSRPSS